MPQFITKLVFTLLFTFSLLQPASAVKIVRLELEYGSDFIIATGGYDIPKTNKVLDLELYDNVTPVTVANFLNYVRNGLYDLSFINRSVPGFVLQTGGVTNISAPDEPIGPGTGPTFFEVPAFPSIINEPELSNSRGTIAMAKVAAQFVEGDNCVVEGPGCTLIDDTGPDSATSEWFINLKDNSTPLDTDNGGFTVFGNVIDDGMETADQIAEFPILSIPFLISDLPIADADPNADPNAVPPPPDFTRSNLIMVLTVREINRPILRFTPANGDFGIDVIGDVIGKSIDVVLKNTGNEPLVIGAISTSALNSPFSILSEDCSNTSLESVSVKPASFCTVSLQFLTAEIGIFNDSLIIDYINQANGDSFSVRYHLLGKGSHPVPTIVAVDELDVGTSQINGFSSTKSIVVRNAGEPPLQILAISGLSSTDFSQTNDCIGSDILFDETCTITVSFTTSNLGAKIATLSIESNDPENNFINIELSGYGDKDSDGVLTLIEDSAPNSGDNDIDGIIDSLQNNVASFISDTDEYISLIVDNSNVVTNILLTPEDQLNNLPADISFSHGVFEFDVVAVQPGSLIEFGFILPAGNTPEAFYIFGETVGNVEPHWYQYPEAQIFADALNKNGSVENYIKIRVQDGGIGDADQEVNGKIHIGPAAPSYLLNNNGSSNSSGYLNIMFIVLYLLVLTISSGRYKKHH